jgi:hypothetical protein
MNRLKRYLSPERQRSPLRIQVQLHNDIIIVHPKDSIEDHVEELDDSDSTVDDCLFSGNLFVTHEPYLHLDSVRIGIVIIGKYDLPQKNAGGKAVPQDGIVYSQYQTYLESEMETTLSDGHAHIRRKIAFDMLLPSSLATWEALPSVEILPQIRVEAEYSYNSLSTKAISPPLSSEERERGGKDASLPEEGLAHIPDLVMKKWTGTGNVEHPRCESC